MMGAAGMRIVFIGPPGAGKGTQAVRLANQLQVPHLSTGEILREACRLQTEIGAQACQTMAAGGLVSDELVQQMVATRIEEKDCQQGYILDGFPRTLRQAEMFDALLAQRCAVLDVVLNIRVEEHELLKRLAGRGRQDDDTMVIKNRLEQYEILTHPLLSYYLDRGKLHAVDGHASPDRVHAEILQIMHQVSESKGNSCSN